ncbi:MAG: RbsD/FucU family protein [Bacillota bacterium]
MLKTKLIHPDILRSLAAAGHGSKVLIADGNYPFTTATNPVADLVFLNLAPGIVKVTEVLDVILSAIPVEAAHVMRPDEGGEPPIFSEFRALLGGDVPLQPLGRHDFYDAAKGSDLALAVATGDQRWYANILLTIGAFSER